MYFLVFHLSLIDKHYGVICNLKTIKVTIMGIIEVVDFIGSNDSSLVMTFFMVSYFFSLNLASSPLFAYLKYIKIIIIILSLTFNNHNKKLKSQNLGQLWIFEKLDWIHYMNSLLPFYYTQNNNFCYLIDISIIPKVIISVTYLIDMFNSPCF